MAVFYGLNVLFQLLLLSLQGNAAGGLIIYGGKQVPRRSILIFADMSPHQSIGDTTENETDPESRTSCFWRGKGEGSTWEERIRIEDLSVGQKLSGHIVQDLLDGKTGPKLFYECGVGRTANSRWSIVHGMLRLPRSKPSVARKRAARLRKKKACELYVSRIQVECNRFEVCTTEEEAEEIYNAEKKRPISSLLVGEEVTGVVKKLLPYGAMVDVGANRVGLLHIKTVAELYNRFIDKEKGLEAAGLERGAKIRLSVAAIDKRRLSLEFTPDVRNASKNETKDNTSLLSNVSDCLSTTELAEWAEYATETPSQGLTKDEEDVDYDDEEDYDEDKDIEDSLGLGFY